MAALDYRDFYIKYPEHSEYSENIINTETKTDLIINKLELILSTNKGDYIGDLNFGADLAHYLWETYVSADKIKSAIIEQINRYIPELNSTQYTIEANVLKGEIRDILIINITINEKHIQAVLK
jgi:phage baseplate assembly protein W